MTVYTNECVDCGLPCIGQGCPYQNVATIYCDVCGDGNTYADYCVDGTDMCTSCAEQYVKSVLVTGDFEDLSLSEKALEAEIDLIDLR